MANADRCVMCGAIIPEGRMICPTCERGVKPASTVTSGQALGRRNAPQQCEKVPRIDFYELSEEICE